MELLRQLMAWLREKLSRESENDWVEPGNAITRRVLSDAELPPMQLPEPAALPAVAEETEAEMPAPDVEPAVAQAEPPRRKRHEEEPESEEREEPAAEEAHELAA